MTRLVVVLAGALVVVLAIGAFAPATLADERLATATGGRLRVAMGTGTVWHGRGVVVDTRGSARVPIEWRLDPWSLVGGSPSIALHAPEGGIPAYAVDAAAGGLLSLAAPSLVVDGERLAGDVRIDWRAARIAVAPTAMLDLGTVSAVLSGSGASLEGPVEARGGHVVAKGKLAVSARDVRLDVEVAPAPDAPPQAREWVARLGVPDARGSVRVAVTRELR